MLRRWWRRAGAALLIVMLLAAYHTSLVTAQMVKEFWAPATYRVNRRATVLLERRLDWGQT